MSDPKQLNEEEYHYPEEEYVVDTQQAPVEPQAESKTTKISPVWKQFLLRNKRMVVVLSVVLVVIIVFQVSSYKKNNKVIMQAKPETVATQQMKPSQENADTTEQNLQLQQSLNELQQKNSDKDGEITELKNQLGDLKSAIQASAETNDQLKQAMSLLLEELKHLNARMHEQQHTKLYTGPKLVYTVRAIVPGRAWVVGSNGLSESVTVGDPIPGYGLVETIEPDRGFVTTSTGKDIRYGHNDY